MNRPTDEQLQEFAASPQSSELDRVLARLNAKVLERIQDEKGIENKNLKALTIRNALRKFMMAEKLDDDPCPPGQVWDEATQSCI